MVSEGNPVDGCGVGDCVVTGVTFGVIVGVGTAGVGIGVFVGGLGVDVGVGVGANATDRVTVFETEVVLSASKLLQ